MMQIMLVLSYAVVLWFITIYRIFKIEEVNMYFIILALTTQVVDIIVEETTDRLREKIACSTLNKILKKHYCALLLLLYLCAVIIEK